MAKRSRLYPIPEWNKGEKGAGWKILDSGGGMAPAYIGDKVIQTSLDGPCALCGEAHGRAQRYHELAHLAFTRDKKGRVPRLPKDIQMPYFQVVEDVRMDFCIQSTGIVNPPLLCEYEAPKFIAAIKAMDDRDRVLWAVCSNHGADQNLTKEWLQQAVPPEASLQPDQIIKIMDQVRHQLESTAPSVAADYSYIADDGSEERGRASFPRPRLRDTKRVARWLQNLLGAMGVDDSVQGSSGQGAGNQQEGGAQQEGGDSNKGNQGEGKEEESEGEALSMDESDEWYDSDEGVPAAEEGDDENPGDPARSNPNPHNEESGWGQMLIETVPFERSLPGRLIQVYRGTNEGFLTGDLGRWMTDQKIFKSKRRIPGGTVLVDCSGSMALTAKQVFEWMMQFPGVKVACYSGDGRKGWLRIIADKGKVCNDTLINPPGGTNTVDGPALAWLGKETGPRVWISDGYVNGIGGTREQLYFDRDMLVSRHRIEWVNTTLIADGYDPLSDDYRGRDKERLSRSIVEETIAALKRGQRV